MVKAAKDTPGELLFQSVTDNWSLHAGDIEVLQMAATLRDQIAECDSIVARDGILTTGSRGQLMAHPAVQLGKQLRVAFANLISKLDLEYPEDK